ncbi:MAG: radical SAM protein [Sorangiineae bacterium]|nr:radical SAM protein [Polyangiaceae bacterium]MEB2321838.1 radical SAM protein [Sorangiineae bacterium]
MLARPDLRLKIVENKAETLSIAIRRRGEIFLKMSRASNNHCRFCNDAPFQDGTFWDFEAMTAMIDEGLAQGVRRVFLSGGEPTIHPRFLDVIAYARDRGAERVTVITNGRMFAYESFAKRAVARGLSEAFVAVLGRDAATHDHLSQNPGSFEQTRAGIQNLLATGRCRVSLSTVVNKVNVSQLSELLTLIPGVAGLTAVRVAPAGRALFESLDELGLDDEAARPHVAQARSVAEALGLEFRPKLFPADYFEGFETEYVHHEEYLPEIKDTELRTRLFSRFAEAGEDILCRGEACRVCYRRPFCDALYALRKDLLAGRRAIVRCDLDDERQLTLLASVRGERRLWLVARHGDTVRRALEELQLEEPPAIVEIDELGDGPVPRSAMLLVRADAVLSPSTDFSPAERVGLVLSAGAEPTPALRARAELVVVPTWERMRDEQRHGVDPRAAEATELPVAGLPACLARSRAELPPEEDVIDLIAVKGPNSLDVVGFTHLFLRRLDRTKSVRCRTCRVADTCGGVHVNLARRIGLARLTPLGDK